MRIRLPPFPAKPVIEPDRTLLALELFQVVAVLVGEYQLAGLGQPDVEFTLLGVLVASRTQGNQKLGESLASLAETFDVVDLQEKVVGAAGGSTAVSVTS